MTVYIDILFMENMTMNLIILYGTGLILKAELKTSRIFLSALLGTMHSIIEYLRITQPHLAIVMKFALSVIMMSIAFNPQTVKRMLKTVILFYMISFATGGCAFGLIYLLNPNNITMKNEVILVTQPFIISVIAGVISFIIIQYSFWHNKRKINARDLICKMDVIICGKHIRTKAFVDSGNILNDPYTKEPVIVIEQRILKNCDNFKDIEKVKLEGGDNRYKIRWIPYKSIGKSQGLLMGIKADYIEIEFEDEKVRMENVTVGIYENKISDTYSALVGLNIFEGGNGNEYNVNTKKNILQHSQK